MIIWLLGALQFQSRRQCSRHVLPGYSKRHVVAPFPSRLQHFSRPVCSTTQSLYMHHGSSCELIEAWAAQRANVIEC